MRKASQAVRLPVLMPVKISGWHQVVMVLEANYTYFIKHFTDIHGCAVNTREKLSCKVVLKHVEL